jgi:hypothetical protein
MVPPAVNVPQAIALYRLELAETVMNRKCSVLLVAALALALAAAVVTLVPAITAAMESVPAAAAKALRMMPPVTSAADCGRTLARALDGSPEFDRHLAEQIFRQAGTFSH